MEPTVEKGVYRPKLLTKYIDNQVKYLKTLHPNAPYEKVRELVVTEVKQKLKRPKATIIHHPSPGNSELKKVDLLTHIQEHSHRIITPSGTIFYSTDEKHAFDKQFIDNLREGRNKAKKAMLKYKSEGDLIRAGSKNNEQATKKIRVNSIIGSNGNDQNAMYDQEAFCGVTSLARHGIISAYAFTERFLTSNFYFPDFESVINCIVTSASHCPSENTIMSLVKKYNLAIPLPCDVAEIFVNCLHRYVPYSPKHERHISTMIENLSLHERIFIFYSRNLYNLFTNNDSFWKSWMKDFFNTGSTISEEDLSSCAADDLWTIDKDLLQVIATLEKDKLAGMQITDTPSKSPEIAKYLAAIGKRLQSKLDDISDLIDVFLHSETFMSNIHYQRSIVRKCVAISDTDSVIFTTYHLLKWYLNGTFKFVTETYHANALIVYLITKSIGSFIRKMSISRGATGDNIDVIEMKNEYMYPVLIKTALGKHYAGTYTIQEGNFLPKPTLDIKGVSFMSSKTPSVTHEFTKKLIEDIQEDVLNHTEVYLSDYIYRVYEYEQTIFQSLKSGEFTYFNNETIRHANEYKKPEASIYANYLFWKEVFADKYGDINIPTKAYMIPVYGKLFRNADYLKYVKSVDANVHDRLVRYIEKLPKNKTINRIPLPTTISGLPKEIEPILYLRDIVYKNTAAAQLTLKSIGADLGFAKRRPLFSDMYSFSVVR